MGAPTPSLSPLELGRPNLGPALCNGFLTQDTRQGPYSLSSRGGPTSRLRDDGDRTPTQGMGPQRRPLWPGDRQVALERGASTIGNPVLVATAAAPPVDEVSRCA